MKNKIMFLIFVIILILFILITLNGLSVGQVELFSVKQLLEKNKILDSKVKNITQLTSAEYPSKVNTMEEAYSKLKIQKQKYEGMTDIQDSSEQIHEIKQYDVEYLWKTIGKYSTSRQLGINMNIEKGASSDLYNLNFNIKGTYVNILQFITDLENDSDLQFRIYDFTMSGTNNNNSTTDSKSTAKTNSNTNTTNSDTEKNNDTTSETNTDAGEEKNKNTTTTNSSSSNGIVYSTFTVKNVKINSSSITTR